MLFTRRATVSFLCGIFLSLLFPSAFSETIEHDAVSFAPSVDLKYAVRIKYTAMSIGGRSTIQWKQDNQSYQINTVANGNMFGDLLVTSSSGLLGEKGLQPLHFTEKRYKRDETKIDFDYDKKILTFSSQKEFPLQKEIQDQTSVVWQLIAIVRAHPDKFIEGNTISFMVTSKNSVNEWVFHIGEKATIVTPLGDFETVYLLRTDAKGKTTEVWLSPTHEYYPIKLIFTDNKGLRLEQILKEIHPL